MDFDYAVADPTGNITVLITSPYSADTRLRMIQEAFTKEPACEQVGFVMPGPGSAVRLEMMGYEFCGNATLSTAALHALSTGITPGGNASVTVKSSGAEEPVVVSLKRFEDIPDGERLLPSFEGTLVMPRPQAGFFRGYPLISTEGISHLLVPESDFSEETAEKIIVEYAHELGVQALGMMLIDGTGSDPDDLFSSDMISIRPLVCVPGSDTVIWEHGCATGSTALGWYRWHLDHSVDHTEIKQPGGTIRIDTARGQLLLTGRVIFRSL